MQCDQPHTFAKIPIDAFKTKMNSDWQAFPQNNVFLAPGSRLAAIYNPVFTSPPGSPQPTRGTDREVILYLETGAQLNPAPVCLSVFASP